MLTWQVVDGPPGAAPALVVRLDGPGATDDELVAVAIAYVQDRTGVAGVERDARAGARARAGAAGGLRARTRPQPSERMPEA